MKFAKDEELFQNIPTKGTQRGYDSMDTTDSPEKTAEPVCAAYDRSYQKAADETRAAHKGFIRDTYTQEEIDKDFGKIAEQLDRALMEHLEATDGYIGEFPQSKQYYATVGQRDDYYFDYFRHCVLHYDLLFFPMKKLDALVNQEKFKMDVTKNAFALFAAVVCIALMWFCQGWFFIYEGLSLVKIAALTLVFVVLLALIWWTSHDPSAFIAQFDADESPVGYLSIGLVLAVLVRIFLSGSTAAMVCCVAAGLSGVCFLVRMLAARKRLRQIQSCSPVLRELSSEDCKQFEQNAQKLYRLERFRELWRESENREAYKQNLEYERQSLMEYIERYEQWRCKYLRDSDDTTD